MKVLLNPEEVKEAIVKYVKDNYLNSYGPFDVEVLNIMDEDGDNLGLDCKAQIEVGVSKNLTPQAAPCMPVAPSVPAHKF